MPTVSAASSTLTCNGADALRVLDADEPGLGEGFPTPEIRLRSGAGHLLVMYALLTHGDDFD